MRKFIQKIQPTRKGGLDKGLNVCQNLSVDRKILGQQLISKIEKKQRRLGLSDKEVAERLGCKRATWQATRTGRIPVGMKILLGADIFLSNDANKLPTDANKSHLIAPFNKAQRALKGSCMGLLERIRK